MIYHPDNRKGDRMVGVIRPTPASASNNTDYVYDYFIKDYLGNVRVVLTEEDATIDSTKFLASMEDVYRQIEINNFDNVGETAEDLPTGYPATARKSVWINGSVELNERIALLSAANGTEIGPSMVLPVRRGDKVSLQTEYFYSEDDQTETYDNFGLLVNEVLLALASSGAGILQLSEGQLVDIATGSGNYGPAVSDFMSSNFDTTDVTRPHAYLIWVLYDNSMKLLPAGSGILRVTDPNELERLLQDEILIAEDGYLHAYVANNSAKPLNFDNFLVAHIRGKTRQINHYYPYGLSISGLGGDYDEYLNKYTGKELQTGEFDPAVSTGLEMFDFHARFYDPQLGRWFVADPHEQFHNPYLAMGNNPIMYKDPNGEWVHIVIGAVIGGTLNWAFNGAQFNAEGLGYFGVGALAGGLAAGVGAGVGSAIAGNAAAGGGFAAGFFGTATIGSTGFVAGAVTGAAAGVTNGLIQGAGNGLVGGDNIGDAFSNGLDQAWKQGASGAAFGGIIGGIDAANKGRDFWLGGYKSTKITPSQSNLLADADNSIVKPSDNGTFYTVKNQSGETIYYKPEANDPVRGIRGDGAYPLRNNRALTNPVDGVTAPGRPGEVFKITDPFSNNLTGVTVFKRFVSVEPRALWPIPNDINRLGGGGWLSSPPPGGGWDEIFQRAGFIFR